MESRTTAEQEIELRAKRNVLEMHKTARPVPSLHMDVPMQGISSVLIDRKRPHIRDLCNSGVENPGGLGICGLDIVCSIQICATSQATLSSASSDYRPSTEGMLRI